MSETGRPPLPHDVDTQVPSAPTGERPAPPAGSRVRKATAGLAERVRAGVLRFPAVAALALVAFLVSALDAFDVTLPQRAFDLREACLLSLPLAVVARLACERFDRERHAAKAQAIVAPCAAAALLALLLVGEAVQREELLTLARYGIALAALCLVPWLLMDDENQDTLVPNLVSACTYVGLVTLVLFCGLCICTLAAEVLIFGDGGPLDPLYEVFAALCWLLLAPNLVCAMLPRPGERVRPSRAYHGVVGYAIFPLCLLLLLVLYGYIAKIAVLRSMPVGEMNWFGSFALLVWAGLWCGLRDLSWPPARWFVRWGWALLVPVVAVQLLGVSIRLHAYGLTLLRCASLACTGLGIFALVMAALNRSPRIVWLAMAAAAVALCVLPTNVIDMANLSQTMRLRQALESAGMLDEDGLVRTDHGDVPTDEQRERIVSAWDYLRYAERCYLVDPMVEDLRRRSEGQGFEELFGFPRTDVTEDASYDWHWIQFVADGASVDVAGFSRAYDLDDAERRDGRYPLTAQGGFVLDVTWEDGTSLEVDLSELVARMGEGVDTGHGSPMLDNEFEVGAEELRVPCDDGRVLALDRLELEIEQGEVTEATPQGLLLVP